MEGVCVTSTKGKLEVLKKHYQHLGRVSVVVIGKRRLTVKWKSVVGCQGHVRMHS